MMRVLLTFIVATVAAQPQPGLYHAELEASIFWTTYKAHFLIRIGVDNPSTNEGWMNFIFQGVGGLGVDPQSCWGTEKKTHWTYDNTTRRITFTHGCAIDIGAPIEGKIIVYSEDGVPSITVENLDYVDTQIWERLCMTEAEIDAELPPTCCNIEGLGTYMESKGEQLVVEYSCAEPVLLSDPTNQIGSQPSFSLLNSGPGADGSLCGDNNRSHNLTECAKAAASLGYSDPKAKYFRAHPYGCLKVKSTNRNLDQIWFNSYGNTTHPVRGQTGWAYESICKPVAVHKHSFA